MKSANIWLLAFLLFCFLSSHSQADISDSTQPNIPVLDNTLLPDSVSNDSITAESKPAIFPPDTVILTPTTYTGDADRMVIKTYLSENYNPPPKRSPSMTMLKSVVFPGWGQYSNRKRIKSGVIFAVESYFIYKTVDYGIKAGDSRKIWKSISDDSISAKTLAFQQYTDDRDNRNTNIWYTAIIMFLSMIDAYVDAHLQDFPEPADKAEEAKNLSLELLPEREAGFRIVYNF
ncbi:MAG: hypothetical protein KAR42_03285 [candidate division Zixibacteria bacterium]|nr:hypothetical protein [candidate division Zixibacteria bacterium]